MLRPFNQQTEVVEVSAASPVTLEPHTYGRRLRLAANVSIHVNVGDDATDGSLPIFEYQPEEVMVPANQVLSILGAEDGAVWITELSRD